jgi:hypothetical protein
MKNDYQISNSVVWNRNKTYPMHLHEGNLFQNVFLEPTPTTYDGPDKSRLDGEDVRLENLEKLLSQFDLVLTDTLTWPLKLVKDSIFLGQFTWEFYHNRLARTSSSQHVKNLGKALLNHRAFAMKPFAWEEMDNFEAIEYTSILDYWNLRNAPYSRNDQVVISLSGTGKTSIEELTLSAFDPIIVNGLENYIYSKKQIPLAVVCRPGLGIISECIAARVIPIIHTEEEIEMKINENILLNTLGIGVTLHQIQNLRKNESVELLKNLQYKIDWPDVLKSSTLARKLLFEL